MSFKNFHNSMFVSTHISLWPTPNGLAHMLLLFLTDIMRGALSFTISSIHNHFLSYYRNFRKIFGSGLKKHPSGHYKRSESTVFA